MDAASWTITAARSKLGEVIERAQTSGPQTVTKNGRVAAVVVSVTEWERRTGRVGNLAEFFATSPLRGSGLKVDRVKDSSP